MNHDDDLSTCLVMNTVAAARALLRRYDARLKPFGLTVQQLALLATLQRQGEIPPGDLARHAQLDRTSLIRNLGVLERKKLVTRVVSQPGRQRICALTEEGASLVQRLLPEWRIARAAEMSEISDEEAAIYLRVAKQLTGV